ncbi:MAG: hypothetical protein ABFQ62_03240 [Patescibacteria group bacterium]
MKAKKVRTTITLSNALYKDLKEESFKKGITLSDAAVLRMSKPKQDVQALRELMKKAQDLTYSGKTNAPSLSQLLEEDRQKRSI